MDNDGAKRRAPHGRHLDGGEVHLSAGLSLEERGIITLCGTADTREGVRWFVERRTPVFEGR